MYSVLEQHIDGSWWYHPGMTYDTAEEAEEGFNKHEWLGDRPHKIFEHSEPMYQKWSTCTKDFMIFEFGGRVYWPKEYEGRFVKETGRLR